MATRNVRTDGQRVLCDLEWTKACSKDGEEVYAIDGDRMKGERAFCVVDHLERA